MSRSSVMGLMDLIVKGCKYVDEACAEIRRRFAFRTLDADQRRKVQGQWFKNGIEIAGKAAHYRDLYDRYLPGVPYSGDDMRDKAARVTTAREVWAQLDLLTRQARDTYLIERAELHAMSMGIRKALQATASYPFLPEADRQNIQAGIHALRTELDQKNRKISRTKKAAGQRKAEARAAVQAALDTPLPAPPPSPPPPQVQGGLRQATQGARPVEPQAAPAVRVRAGAAAAARPAVLLR